MTKEAAQQELEKLRKDSTKFYESPAGLAQLAWLDQFEANLITNAIKANNTQEKLSSLDQAKGLRAFRGYIETLITKN